MELHKNRPEFKCDGACYFNK